MTFNPFVSSCFSVVRMSSSQSHLIGAANRNQNLFPKIKPTQAPAQNNSSSSKRIETVQLLQVKSQLIYSLPLSLSLPHRLLISDHSFSLSLSIQLSKWLTEEQKTMLSPANSRTTIVLQTLIPHRNPRQTSSLQPAPFWLARLQSYWVMVIILYTLSSSKFMSQIKFIFSFLIVVSPRKQSA